MLQAYNFPEHLTTEIGCAQIITLFLFDPRKSPSSQERNRTREMKSTRNSNLETRKNWIGRHFQKALNFLKSKKR